MKTKELGVIAVKITGIACLVVAVFKLQHVIIHFLQYQTMCEQIRGSGLVALATVLSFAIIFLAGLGLLLAGKW